MLEADDFARLLSEEVPFMRRYALALVKDDDVAADLVQDVCLRAWRSRHTYHSGSLRCWLTVIIRNTHFGNLRRLRTKPEGNLVDVAAQIARDDLARVLDSHMIVERLMDDLLPRLTENAREAITRLCVDGETYGAAAAGMGCEIGTAKSRVFRAKDELRRLLGEEQHECCVSDQPDFDFYAYDDIDSTVDSGDW